MIISLEIFKLTTFLKKIEKAELLNVPVQVTIAEQFCFASTRWPKLVEHYSTWTLPSKIDKVQL